MKRIAHIENNEIVNVSLADDDSPIRLGCMLESEAIELGIPYKQQVLAAGYHVQPEDFYLSDEKSDETEFNKLITLCKLAIEQKQMSISNPISIRDINATTHIITIQRFFEIMVGYGMHCYANRNY